MKRVLAIIPARGGSKGLPGKNIKLLLDKPLIAWTINAAIASKFITEVVVSTDDLEIKNIAQHFGANVPFVRPAILSQDDTISSEVVLHAISELPDFDIVCYLQPTSPLRTSSDINEAFKLFFELNANCCVSVQETVHSPFWSFRISNGKLTSLFKAEDIPLRRQDLIPTYTLNGAIYIADIKWFFKTKSFLTDETIPYIMPANRSIDIDTLEDFEAAERILLIKENRD